MLPTLPQPPIISIPEEPKEPATRPMPKLTRSQLNAYKIKLVREQGWVCPISLKRFDPQKMEDAVVDHDHITGEVRGVLYRSANAVEGKVTNAVARWGGTGLNYAEVIPYLERLLAYLKAPGKGVIYPFHKTADDRRMDRNKKAREARAAKAAKARLAREKAQ